LRWGYDDGGDFFKRRGFLIYILPQRPWLILRYAFSKHSAIYSFLLTYCVRFYLSAKMEVFSCADLSSYINCDDEAFVDLLQRSSLIRRNLRCKKANCRRYCNLRRREDAVLSHVFFCLRCQRQYSIVDGSFFVTLRVPPRTILWLLWNLVCEIRAGSSAMHLGIPRQTVIQQYRYFRDVCSWKLLQEPDLFLLGIFYIHLANAEFYGFLCSFRWSGTSCSNR
jgi:hypothetical protein